MAKLKRSVITNKGFEALRKSIAQSKKMNFTRLVASDTIYNDSTNITTITTINNIKQSISISEVKEIENNKIKVTGVFKNTGLNTGYAMNTIALYGNVEGETEILFSVTRAEVADYMPATNGINVSTITIEIVLVLSENANISVSLDTSALVTTGMLTSYVKKSWGYGGEINESDRAVRTNGHIAWNPYVIEMYNPSGELSGGFHTNKNDAFYKVTNKNNGNWIRILGINDVYLDDFNANKKLIQTNLATGVTYVSKELSFYGKNETNNYAPLEMRIGVENNKFRVKQNNKWSPMITGDDLATDTQAGLVSLNKIREVAPQPNLNPYLKYSDCYINKGDNVRNGQNKILRCNNDTAWLPNNIDMFTGDNSQNHMGSFRIDGNRALYRAKNRNGFKWCEIMDNQDMAIRDSRMNDMDNDRNNLRNQVSNLENARNTDTVCNLRLSSMVTSGINSNKERDGYVITNVWRNYGSTLDGVVTHFRALQMYRGGAWVNVPFA